MKLPRCLIWGALIAATFQCAFGTKTGETQTLPDTIEKIKPSIVAIGTFEKTRRPPANFRGTGVVVADGLHIITNAHVLGEKIDTEKKKTLRVFAGKGENVDVREATKIAEDRDHDLVILRIGDPPLPAA